MNALTTWLLGGALAASLTWNFTLARGQAASPSGCGDLGNCSLLAADLDLAPDLRGKLSELCASTCGESDRLERRANELERELLDGLAARTADEAATTRVIDEISELRKRSLAACVKGVLGVREVLTSDQMRSMLERCESCAASDKR